MSKWTTEPIFDSLGLIGVVAVAIGVIVILIPPQAARLTPARRRILMTLRLLASIVLLLALLRPTREVTDNQPSQAKLLVMLDGTRSMTLPASNARSRAQVQRQVWDQLAPILADGDESLQVHVFQYSDTLVELDRQAGEVDRFVQNEPQGRLTDLAGALKEGLTYAAGQSLAGVILIGDGTQSAPIQGSGAQAVAGTLAAQEVPLWTVPIGPDADQRTARDLAVEGLADQFHAYANHLFEVTGRLEARGLDNHSVSVRLMISDMNSDEREIARRDVLIDAQHRDQAIRIEVPAPAPGHYRLRLVADPQDGEILTVNNHQSAFLDVADGGGRILYLEGQPRAEQLFLRHSLAASDDFELVFQWLEKSTDAKAGTSEVASLATTNPFEVYIIGDLPASRLGLSQLAQLKQAIAQGAGLLMLGGLTTFDAGQYGATEIAEVLPIELNPATPDLSPKQTSPQLDRANESSGPWQLSGPIKVRPIRNHPMVQLGTAAPGSNQTSDDPSLNQSAWQTLRPLNGANRFGKIKPLPGVDTLLESSTGDPLLVVGTFGKGRVAVFAGDSTWRWWRQGKQDLHRRFWRQVLLWLMQREMTPPGQLDLEIERRRFANDETIAVNVGLSLPQADDKPPTINAAIVDQAGKRKPFELTPANRQRSSSNSNQPSNPDAASISQTVPWRWNGTLTGLDEGLYRLEVQASDTTHEIQPASLAFEVVSLDRELARPIADVTQMQQLALVTESAGGRWIAPDEIDSIKKDLESQRQRSVVPLVQRWRLGDDPRSAWLMLILLVGLLSGEWVMRKIWGLV